MSRVAVLLGALVVLALMVVSPPLGLGVLAVVLFVGLVRWVLTPSGRPCLRCGKRVPNGQLQCEHCGFDFSSVGAETVELR